MPTFSNLTSHSTHPSPNSNLGGARADLSATLRPDKVLRFPTLGASELEPPAPFAGPDVCPICKGSGYLRHDVPVSDSRFGQLFMCSCKATEVEARETAELTRLSNIGYFRDLTFQNFNTRVPGVKEAYEAAKEFAQDSSGWLLLTGNYGCGKTHLAAAIANEAMAKRTRLYFAIVPDLLDALRATFDPNSEEKYDDRFEMIRNVPLLILDDLGTENTKPWAREKLYQIINHRYNACLATVITTNMDLDHVDGRIRSRISDRQLCRTVLIKSNDYRQLAPQERQQLRGGSGSGGNWRR